MQHKTAKRSKMILVAGILAFGCLTLGVSKVLGQMYSLPRVTTACETKIGGVLMGIDDGFSTLKVCPGSSRKVSLGEIDSTSGLPSAGNVFLLGGSVLMKDGSVWFYLNGTGWVKDTLRPLPAGVKVSDIVQWRDDFFLTKSGEIYQLKGSAGWVNVGSPTL